MNEKLIVIGSNSFSGSHFVDHALENGMDVIGISRSQEPFSVYLPYKWGGKNNRQNTFSFFQLDLNKNINKILDLISDFKPEYIINFAAQGMVAESWNTPEQWLMTNTVSAVKLHNHLKYFNFIRKFVQVSTPEVYGSCTGDIKENINYNPSTPYAVSKAAVDMSLMTFFRQYNFPVVFTRSANVYGPGQQIYRIIPRALLYFLTGKNLELHGGGKSIRAFIHINDVVNGTFKAMLSGNPGSIYHFSTSDPLSIRSLVKLLAKATGVSFRDKVSDVNDRSGKDSAYLLKCSKACNELGWKAKISLEEGIKEMLVWIKDNIDFLKQEPLDYIHKP